MCYASMNMKSENGVLIMSTAMQIVSILNKCGMEVNIVLHLHVKKLKYAICCDIGGII